MSEVARLLEQYKSLHLSGTEADPGPFLAQVRGADRAELAGLIDAYLERAPRLPVDPGTFQGTAAARVSESVQRSLTGRSGIWPALLPQLRNRARIKRADLVAELAARLGAQAQQDKVAGYYHEMEQGLLPAAGVSDTVLDALAAVLDYGKEALRSAGAMPAPGEPGAGTGAVFARSRAGAPADAGAEQPVQEEPRELDAVDRLFRGG